MIIETDRYTLIRGCCIEELAKVPDGSVDYVLNDPPYGIMKGLRGDNRHDWDIEIGAPELLGAAQRALRPNGSASFFSQEPYTSKMVSASSHAMPFAYRMAWNKKRPGNILGCRKAHVSVIEDIIRYRKPYPKHDHGGGHPLREYAELVVDTVGLNAADLRHRLGHSKLDHFWRVGTSQFTFCTLEAYTELGAVFGLDATPWWRNFEELKALDTTYRDELRECMNSQFPKIFNLGGSAKKDNLLTFDKPSSPIHPTQKPVALLCELIETFTRPGDTVLDMTMGSGSTGVACMKTGRRFIGIEKTFEHFGNACARVIGAAV